MGRLLRLLFGAVARGLCAIAGRLAPAEAAPLAVQEAPAVEDGAGGPPRHWLEMVRTRAPALHVSLQERGIARVARLAAPMLTSPSVPPASALELRSSPVDPSTGSAAPAVARPVRPTPRPVFAGSPRPVDPQLDMEPHRWEDGSSDEDHEEWTRVATRRTVPMASATPATIRPAVRRLSAADAAVIGIWRPPALSGTTAAPASTNGSNDTRDTRRVATRPDLRPLSATAPVEARHSTATPQFAPARDEDQALHRPLRARADHPTPLPTPWRNEALQDMADGPAVRRFPALSDEMPDEVRDGSASAVTLPGSGTRSSTLVSTAPSSQSPVFSAFARSRPESSDVVNAWPTLSSAPSLGALPTADRWPDLLSDETGEGDDPDLSLPCGHRERLDHEQRGLAWNG